MAPMQNEYVFLILAKERILFKRLSPNGLIPRPNGGQDGYKTLPAPAR